ncbi:MAG TPA: hypothetical protein EYP33_06345 [Pyrodictium sp.]|nr:hypothetical protein [Pyrodictium sp.]
MAARAPQTKGEQKVLSITVDDAVRQVVGLLQLLPPGDRLEVLRRVEREIRPLVYKEGVITRKVVKTGSAFSLYVSQLMGIRPGSYRVKIEGNTIVYEHVDTGGDVKVSARRGGQLRIPLPKWAWEAIGMPSYVRVYADSDRIIVEPAG